MTNNQAQIQWRALQTVPPWTHKKFSKRVKAVLFQVKFQNFSWEGNSSQEILTDTLGKIPIQVILQRGPYRGGKLDP